MADILMRHAMLLLLFARFMASRQAWFVWVYVLLFLIVRLLFKLLFEENSILLPYYSGTIF